LGADALAALGPAALVTEWGTDPLSLGSYAYAGPGAVAQRDVLARAVVGGALSFAGEALRSDGLAGTVGGAYLSGIAAAERLLSPAAAEV
jgi:monoamine oxidase